MNIDILFSRTKIGIGIDKLNQFLSLFGSPQRKLSVIHVAGTNGKGSVCYTLASVLKESGKKVGLFISPHLHSPTERIQINGKSIDAQEFELILQEVFSKETEPLNFFELLTVVAFIYFDRQHVDYVVLETGLGGRKDPTNVCDPLCSVITSIGYDHMSYLGNTLESIAYEKAGVIKEKTPIFIGSVSNNVMRIIQQKAIKKNATVYTTENFEVIKKYSYDFENGYTLLSLKNNEDCKIHLLGEKQVDTARLVWQIASFLGIDSPTIKNGFSKVFIPGRFEKLFYKGKTILLDGAHNLSAMEALTSFWRQSPYAKKSSVICGFMQDKDYTSMLGILVKNFDKGIITSSNSVRSASGECFDGFLKSNPSWYFEENLEKCLDASAETILCTGSFYLVAAMRDLILEKNA